MRTEKICLGGQMATSISRKDMTDIFLSTTQILFRKPLEHGTDTAEIEILASVQKMNMYDLNTLRRHINTIKFGANIPNKVYIE